MSRKVHTRLVAVFVGSLLCSVAAHGQTEKEDDIDLEYRYCKLKDSSSANISDCAFIAYDRWDKQLDAAYKHLDRLLKDGAERDKLKADEKAWETYKDAEFLLFDFMFDKPGSYWCELRHDSRINILRERTLLLRNYYEARKLKVK